MIMENPEKIKIKRPKKFHIYSITFACFILIFSACNCPNIRYMGRYALDIASRKDLYLRSIDNSDWAEKNEIAGVPNFHKVSDGLYRGAQPTIEGMNELKKMGVKTIVNLRSAHSDEDELKGVDLAYKYIPMTAAKPKTEDMISFLNIVTDVNNLPVFVHCRYGSDRTGTVCALYRITVQGWNKDEAIQEMTKGGFGFHSIWGNLPDFIRKCDIEQIKKKAGITGKNGENIPLSVTN
ncbi:MAG: dual specificity protein phosphatase family protein [Sedimentisphaerales bacterium]|nr:dual specificity protein phosphatase family protein [Sedimentisphaerales bacterium]